MLGVLWLVSVAFAVDMDGDGFDGIGSGGLDCDDTSAQINPDADEACELSGVQVDNDCDGNVNTDSGEYATSVATLFPGMSSSRPFFIDQDNDGFGDETATDEIYLCRAGVAEDFYSPNRTDCNDTNPQISPDSPELCNDIDDNCDGDIDEPTLLGAQIDSISLGLDADRDGYGGDEPGLSFCQAYITNNLLLGLNVDGVQIFFAGEYYSSLTGDCDDSDDRRFPRLPGYEEALDGRDGDCDGHVLVNELDCDQDMGIPEPIDMDCRDMGGTSAGPTIQCGSVELRARCNTATGQWDVPTDELPALYTDVGTRRETTGFQIGPFDCDDNDSWRYGGAEEVCDGFDTSCVGTEDQEPDSNADGVSDALQGGIAGRTTEQLLDTNDDGEWDGCVDTGPERFVNGSGPSFPPPEDVDSDTDSEPIDRTPSSPACGGCSTNAGWPVWSVVGLALVLLRRRRLA